MTRTVSPKAQRLHTRGGKSRKPTPAQAQKIRTTFGEHLRAFRERAGLTQEGLSETSGIDRTFISQIERGIRQPSLLSLICMARAMGITLLQLVECVDVDIKE